MRLPVRLIRLALCLAALISFSSAASAQNPHYDALYVFGDSLADNGNDYLFTKRIGAQPAVPPSDEGTRTYFKGRFSNGYVAFEYLWQQLSGNAPDSNRGLKPFLASPILPLASGINFAFGGTGTPFLDQTPGGIYLPGLKGQVELFRLGLLGRKPPKRALYAVVTGTNDYRVEFNVPMSIPAVVNNIIDSIEVLYSIGARDVLVLDLPDLGLLPGAGTPAQRQQQTMLSLAHNQALEAELNALQQRRPKLRLFRGHFAAAFARLPPGSELAIPGIELFASGSSGCLFVNPATCPNLPASVFNAPLPYPAPIVFWDVVHPTTAAHELLAQYLYDLLAAGEN